MEQVVQAGAQTFLGHDGEIKADSIVVCGSAELRHMLYQSWSTNPRLASIIVEAEHTEPQGENEVWKLCGDALRQVQLRAEESYAMQLTQILDPAQAHEALNQLAYGPELASAASAGRVDELLLTEGLEEETGSQLAAMVRDHGGRVVIMRGAATEQLIGFGGRVGFLRY